MNNMLMQILSQYLGRGGMSGGLPQGINPMQGGGYMIGQPEPQTPMPQVAPGMPPGMAGVTQDAVGNFNIGQPQQAPQPPSVAPGMPPGMAGVKRTPSGGFMLGGNGSGMGMNSFGMMRNRPKSLF